MGLSLASLSAQESFGKGTKVLNLGTGLSVWSYSSSSFFPALSASLDYGIKENLGPGTLGVGAFLGFHRTTWNYSNDYKYTWTNFAIGPQATYHPYFAQTEKLDAYVALGLLARFYSYKDSWEDNAIDKNVNSFYIWPSTRLGARYLFSPNFGVFGELGWGISWLTLGVSLKF